MKAAMLRSFGTQLDVGTVPDPVPGTGEVIVDVAAAPVLAYAAEVFSGARQYLLDLPAIPGTGAVGRVRAAGPDATRLAVGDWVFCDPTVRARDDADDPDILLQGWSARGEGGRRLQRHFRHGAFAEQVMVPTENAIPIGSIDPADAARWCALTLALVPYGGLLAAGLRAGETILVSGATGSFGSAGVAVALAMGAGCVVATGRSAAALDDLQRRFGARLRTVRMEGDEAGDRERIRLMAPGPIDCVLDLLPPAASAVQARTAIMAVRRNGRAVLMGGVGMLGGAGLDLPYPWIMRNNITLRGQWMCPPGAVPRMVGMIRAGLLRLDEFDVAAFALDEANAAVAHAASHAGPFRMTVLRP